MHKLGPKSGLERKEKESMVIGLSVSGCIMDIIMGDVNLSDVAFIVGGTKCESSWDWEELIHTYSQTWWRRNPGRASDVLRHLIARGKIIQPRTFGMDPPKSDYRRWLPADEAAKFLAQFAKLGRARKLRKVA